jgi:hypothetical protein
MNNNFSNLKSLVIIGLIVIIIVLRGCNRHTILKEPKQIEIHTIIDTSYKYVTHIDTIPFIDTVKRYINIVVNKPEIVPETGLNSYSQVLSDSLIEGEIISVVNGTLVEQTFTYNPKFPKYILKTDSIFTTIEKTNNITENKRELYLGFELGGNMTKFNISPIISLKDKKYNLYSFRYNVINKTFNIGLQKQIKFKQ